MAIVPHLRGRARSYPLDAANADPRGITQATGLLFVGDWTGARLYAYGRDGARRLERDVVLSHEELDTQDVEGLAGAFGRLHVLDKRNLGVYAYATSDGSRDAGADFALDPENDDARGIVYMLGYFFVVDWSDDKVYAYGWPSGRRVPGLDFDLDPENADPVGFAGAGDGSYLYVVDEADAKVHVYGAFGAVHGDRAPLREFRLDGRQPGGITESQGFVVVDRLDDRIYIYD